ncbi:DUF4184 family protein [Streptomyces sp. SID4919]|uniref:DUF4184 family protein n=1 Tax=unclassified Streptomyces TaxID=2593676 RepID=UPI000823BCF6|nr:MULTISPECIES: DUF4184 family protein [unclassified Streptomyces]MYY07763.1 DUF4184 family protein [Streptomyces sp. SID4919]SCK05411.1 protein of unknown function [Streptomyces sp. AmelKG-E11A]
MTAVPFTLSHLAAVIPVARGPLVPSALAAGAMSPDLLYFVLLRPGGREATHSAWGIVAIDLPLALLALAVFRLLLLEPLVSLAPAAVRTRVAPLCGPPRLSWRGALAVVVSVLLGALTHVVWDAFTHAGGWGVELVPALTTGVAEGIPAFKIAQWTSSALGGLAVLIWSGRWLLRAPAGPVPERFTPPARPALLAGAVVLGAAAVAVVSVAISTQGGFHASLVRATIGAMTGAVLALAGYGLLRRTVGTRAGRPAT